MEAIIFFASVFVMPILAFVFMFLVLDMLFKDKYGGQKCFWPLCVFAP